MSAPMCLARLRTFRSLFQHLHVVSYSKQTNKARTKPAERKPKSGPGRGNNDPKQDPYIAYVEGDPVQQAYSQKTKYGIEQSAVDNIRGNSDSDDTTNKQVKTGRPALETHVVKKRARKDRPIGMIMKMKREPSDILDPVNFTRTQIKTTKFGELKEEQYKNAISYKIIDREDDRRFIKPMLEIRSKKGRERNQEIILEGKALIQDALYAGIKPVSLYFTHSSYLHGILPELLRGAELYKVTRRHARHWLSHDRITNIAGVFKMPEAGKEYKTRRQTIPVTLICDHIREGQSLGNLIHTAAAIGCEQVLVMKGCVDVWDPRALQAGMGSHFVVPIIPNISWSSVLNHLPEVSKTMYAVGTDKQIEKNVIQNLDPIDILQEIERVQEDELFGDPIVAKESSEVSDDNLSDDSDDEEESDVEEIERIPEVYKQAALSVQSYDSVDYTGDHCVMLVSGDPGGISLAARKLVHDEFGLGVEVPKSGDVARMNIAMVGGITLFEVAKQFRRKSDKESQTPAS